MFLATDLNRFGSVFGGNVNWIVSYSFIIFNNSVHVYVDATVDDLLNWKFYNHNWELKPETV